MHLRANQSLLNESLTCSFAVFFFFPHQFFHSKRWSQALQTLCCEWKYCPSLYVQEEQGMCVQEGNVHSPNSCRTQASLFHPASWLENYHVNLPELPDASLLPFQATCLLSIMSGGWLRSPPFYILPPLPYNLSLGRLVLPRRCPGS